MKEDSTNSPWWKQETVWLLAAGPAAVVVAGVVTAWVAITHPDTVIEEDYYRRGIEINRRLAQDRAMLPAVQGRNHAATPGRP